MSIRINLDPANPGQFFACCGLLELANRLWPGAEGCFGPAEFRLVSVGTLAELLGALVECDLSNSMSVAERLRFKELSTMSVKQRTAIPGVEDEYKHLGRLLREAPIVLRTPVNITLDWFVDSYAGGSRYKTWAGQQSVLAISTSMKDALVGASWRNENCLKFSVAACGLPFNFDSDLGGQGGAVDIGFSFDPLAGNSLTRIESTARPALELLAFIGLQRFRPMQISHENRFLYAAWTRPLPIEVAGPAAAGVLPMIDARHFEFRLLYRTKYLKSFLPAVPINRGSHE